MTYTSSASGLTLETAQFAGGVIRLSGTSQEINYLLTDHLGSVRAVVTPTGAVRERNDFYAFGSRHVRSDHPQNANRFKFNGKELQTTGFASSDPAPFLDYGARMYDPALARWFNPDPLAESYFAHSPYHFSGNNPVNLIDQNGMWYDWYLNLEEGLIEHRDGSEDRIDEGLVHLADDDASVEDIEGALKERNYEYRKVGSSGGFEVDTRKQYKAWTMMTILSPEIVGEALGMSLGAGAAATAERGAAKAATKAVAKAAGKTPGNITLQFGRVENQISHAFRHTDALGLDRSLVQSTINNHFKTVSSQVVAGRPFIQLTSGGKEFNIPPTNFLMVLLI